MGRPGTIRSICRLGLLLALAGGSGAVAMAQSTASASVAVRIRPRAAADYDPATEVSLRGLVAGWEGGMILLRIPAGTVRVDAGNWIGAEAIPAGTAVEILAAKRQEEGRQRFLAREIRHAGGILAVRDPQGVPLPATVPQL